MVDVEKWLSYKGTCHVILLAKLHDMYLYKTDNFFHINHCLKSVLKVALLCRFHCTSRCLKSSWMSGKQCTVFSTTWSGLRPLCLITRGNNGRHISRVDRTTVASQIVCFSQYFISSPWRSYEDYNISLCKQWKFRCHCSYEQWHLNVHCLQRGQTCP